MDESYLVQLQDYYAKHGVIPSMAKLAELWGFGAKSWVHTCVTRFKDEGYLEDAPGRRLKPGSRFFERKLAHSAVRAGMPSAVEDGHDLITIDSYLVRVPSKTTLIRVKGDSMIDAGIHEGDLIVVEQDPNPNVGDIVVAIVDNEFTVKYLAQERGKFILKPGNPAYPIIRPTGSLEIFGVMTGLVRKTK